jgi:4-hydroxy-tetrahydrodipicolinate reductase
VLKNLSDFDGKADVIIDFSNHACTKDLMDYAVRTNTPCVVATTGHTVQELEMIDEAAKSVAIFRSANMSIGIAVLADFAKRAAALMPEADIEIIEKHHNQKLDAPSGTALMLEKAAEAGVDYTPSVVYDRHTERKKREKTEIGMHSVRGGTIVGEHEVIFAGHDEVVTLSHSAQSREVFARGALSAAVYMKGKSAGMYSMKDVIESVI